MTLKDSSEDTQGCLMTYYCAFDGNLESLDGEARLFGISIGQTDTILLPVPKKAKWESTLDKLPIKIKHESNKTEN